jgi:hypothetical protein
MGSSTTSKCKDCDREIEQCHNYCYKCYSRTRTTDNDPNVVETLVNTSESDVEAKKKKKKNKKKKKKKSKKEDKTSQNQLDTSELTEIVCEQAMDHVVPLAERTFQLILTLDMNKNILKPSIDYIRAIQNIKIISVDTYCTILKLILALKAQQRLMLVAVYASFSIIMEISSWMT